MFSNVSARWRRRIHVAVAVWAVLLIAVAFAGTRATVREQVDAAAARTAMDAVVGEAAAALSGAAVLAVGPLKVEECDVTPARSGLALARTLQISGAAEEQIGDLAARLDLVPAPDASVAIWNGGTADYLDLRITAPTVDPAGGRYAEPVEFQAITGCRPAGTGVGTFIPSRPEAAEASWQYGAVECPAGTHLESWTEPVEAEPFAVHKTTGACA